MSITSKNLEKSSENSKLPKDGRARHWTALVYPESAPENWIEQLRAQGVAFAVSPLHDKDVYLEDVYDDGTIIHKKDEPKKSHWHVVLSFEGKKSLSQMNSILECTNGARPQIVHSMTGALNYLTHKNNPEKYQYSKSEIQCFNGFDYDKHIVSSVSEIKQMRRDILSFCRMNNVTELRHLLDYCMISNEEWEDLLMDSVSTMSAVSKYISSIRYAERNQKFEKDVTIELVDKNGVVTQLTYKSQSMKSEKSVKSEIFKDEEGTVSNVVISEAFDVWNKEECDKAFNKALVEQEKSE